MYLWPLWLVRPGFRAGFLGVELFHSVPSIHFIKKDIGAIHPYILMHPDGYSMDILM
jgi:hypothetical protein